MAGKAYKLKLFFSKEHDESMAYKKMLWENHKEVNQLAREYELLLLLLRGESLRMKSHPAYLVHVGEKGEETRSETETPRHFTTHNPLAYGLHAAKGVASSLNRDLLECIKDLKPQLQDRQGVDVVDIKEDLSDHSTDHLYHYSAEDMKRAGLKFVRLNQERIANLSLTELQKSTNKKAVAEYEAAKEAQERLLGGERGSDDDILTLLGAYHKYFLPEAVLGADGNVDPKAKGKPANSFGGEPSFMYNFASEAGNKSYIGDETYAVLERLNDAILKHREESFDADGKSFKPAKVYTMPAEGLAECGSIMNQGDLHLGISALLGRRTGNTPGWLKDPYFSNWNDAYNRERLMPQTYAQLNWVTTLYEAQKKSHNDKKNLDRGAMQQLGVVPCISDTAGATTLKMALIIAIEHMKAWSTWVTKAKTAVEDSSTKVDKGTAFIEKLDKGAEALAAIDAYEKWYTTNQGDASGNEAKGQFIANTATIKQWQNVVEALYGVELKRLQAQTGTPWDDDITKEKRDEAIKLVQQKNSNFGDFPFFEFVAKVGNEYLWQQEEFMTDIRQGVKPKNFLWQKFDRDTTTLEPHEDDTPAPLFVLIATLGLWKKEQGRIRDFAIYTPPNHIFNPQWIRYESSGTNYDKYKIQGSGKGINKGSFDGKGLYEIALGNMGLPPKKRKAKKGEELPPDVGGDDYPKIQAVRTSHFDIYDKGMTEDGKKVTVEFFSNYKQFTGILMGGKIIYDRNMLARLEIARLRGEASDMGSVPKSTPDSILGGASFISITVDVEPILANSIDKEIVRNHGTGNDTITKALQVGDNILSIDLGVRTFASCTVFEITDTKPTDSKTLCFPITDRSKDNLYGVLKRSFPLNMPGEDATTDGIRSKNARRGEDIRNEKYDAIGFLKAHINFIKGVNPSTDRKGKADMLSDILLTDDNLDSIKSKRAKGEKALRAYGDANLNRNLDNYLETCRRVNNSILSSIAANIAANPNMGGIGIGTTKEAKRLALRNMALLPEGSSVRQEGFKELKDSFNKLIFTWYRIQKQSNNISGSSRKKGRMVVWGKTAAAIDYYDRIYQLMKGWQNMGRTDYKFGGETVERTGRFLRSFKDHILNLREDRVKVGSDLIIRAALGYRPVKISQRRLELADTSNPNHTPKVGSKAGWELVEGAKPCKLILFEDLDSYRTTFARDRQGNRTLMTWSHRAILETVEKAADAYKMKVITVAADYTSQFNAENGAPGVRGYAIGRYGDLDINGKRRPVSRVPVHILKGVAGGIDDEGNGNGGYESLSRENPYVNEMIELARMGAYENRITGFAIKKGGPDFMSVKIDDEGNRVLCVSNADVNAATNLQTRYLRWDRSWNKILVKTTADSSHCDPAPQDNLNMFMKSFNKYLQGKYGDKYRFEPFNEGRVTFGIRAASSNPTDNTTPTLTDEEIAAEVALAEELSGKVVVAKGTFNLFRDPSGILMGSDRYFSAQKGIFWRLVKYHLGKLATPFEKNTRNSTGITIYDLSALEKEAKKGVEKGQKDLQNS